MTMEYITSNKGGRKLAFGNNIYIKQKVLSNGTVWGDIMGGFCPGGFCLGGFCPRGDFVQGDLVRGILSGGDFVRGDFVLEPIKGKDNHGILLKIIRKMQFSGHAGGNHFGPQTFSV